MILFIGVLIGSEKLIVAGLLFIIGVWFMLYALRDLLKAIAENKEGVREDEKE